MKQILIPAVGLTLVLTVLTGLIYPLMVTGLAQALVHAVLDTGTPLTLSRNGLAWR